MDQNLLPVPKHLIKMYTIIAALISPYLIAGALCQNMTHNNVQNDTAVLDCTQHCGKQYIVTYITVT